MNVLYDAKQFYDLFFNKGMWNEEMANEVFADREDSHLRKECVKFIYRMITENNQYKELNKWISSHCTIEEVAKIYGVSIQNYRAILNKFLEEIGKSFDYKDTNMLKFCIMSDTIKKVDWARIYDTIDNVKLYHGHMLESEDLRLDSSTNILKLPVASSYSEISDDDFEKVVELLEPYFVSVFKMNQLKVGKYVKVIEYFNYILDSKNYLTEEDLKRKEILTKLIVKGKKDEEVEGVDPSIKRFSDMSAEEQEKLVNNNKKKRIQF